MESSLILLLEIKECTDILRNDNDFILSLEKKSVIKSKNLVVLSFVEDQFTEEYIGYLYDRASKNTYLYVFQPQNKKLLLNEVIIEKLSESQCRTISVLNHFLNLTEEEISTLD